MVPYNRALSGHSKCPLQNTEQEARAPHRGVRVPDNGRHMPSTNPPPSPATPEFERRRILVVDDDETSRAILENIFFIPSPSFMPRTAWTA